MSLDVLTKIEEGRRALDPDDVVAFALAFNVSVLRLLLPVDDDETARIDLMPNSSPSAGAAWRWAIGKLPLSEDPDELLLTEVNQFRLDSQPWWLRTEMNEDDRKAQAMRAIIAQVAERAEAELSKHLEQEGTNDGGTENQVD